MTLSDGTSVNADLMVVGVGVKPSTELAERAGLTMTRHCRERVSGDERTWRVRRGRCGALARIRTQANESA